MASARRLEELARFLRARRASVTPEMAGLPGGTRRRTPGLRREEVAQLADVGVTWYTWLEQGRDIRMSREALDRIAHALRLTATDRAYLFDLVDLDVAEPISHEVDKAVQAVLDSLEAPAMVMNARNDLLAFNSLINEIYRYTDYTGRFARNLVWRLFMDPWWRKIIVNWAEAATRTVKALRAQYASRISDASFEELVAELSKSSPEFARLWLAQSTAAVALVAPGQLNVPRLGTLLVRSTRFFLADGRGDILVVLVPADAQTAAIFAKERARLQKVSAARPQLDSAG